MKSAKVDYDNKDRKIWVMDHKAQIVATVSNIMWTYYTEYSIMSMAENPSAMSQWSDTNYSQLSELTALVRGGLSSIDHKTIVALITQDVHARDIVENLSDENVSSV